LVVQLNTTTIQVALDRRRGTNGEEQEDIDNASAVTVDIVSYDGILECTIDYVTDSTCVENGIEKPEERIDGVEKTQSTDEKGARSRKNQQKKFHDGKELRLEARNKMVAFSLSCSTAAKVGDFCRQSNASSEACYIHQRRYFQTYQTNLDFMDSKWEM
jgi:hypothetical protein